MKVYLATDHAGFELKEKIKQFLFDNDYEVEDCGATSFDKDDDYPDFISLAANAISKNPTDAAIIFGGSGQGEAIVANRYKEVRAVVYNTENLELIKLAREHNNANVLSIGARFVSEDNAKEAIQLFLETRYPEEERHQRRIEKIDKLSLS